MFSRIFFLHVHSQLVTLYLPYTGTGSVGRSTVHSKCGHNNYLNFKVLRKGLGLLKWSVVRQEIRNGSFRFDAWPACLEALQVLAS